jgi:hypothetical protein
MFQWKLCGRARLRRILCGACHKVQALHATASASLYFLWCRRVAQHARAVRLIGREQALHAVGPMHKKETTMLLNGSRPRWPWEAVGERCTRD